MDFVQKVQRQRMRDCIINHSLHTQRTPNILFLGHVMNVDNYSFPLFYLFFVHVGVKCKIKYDQQPVFLLLSFTLNRSAFYCRHVFALRDDDNDSLRVKLEIYLWISFEAAAGWCGQIDIYILNQCFLILVFLMLHIHPFNRLFAQKLDGKIFQCWCSPGYFTIKNI